jgi:hypothetical protein
VSTLFRRKSTATVIESTEPEPTEPEATRSKNYTPSKRELGVATPKRTGANPRRPTVTPATRREASSMTRDARRRESAERREAMMNGEEYALNPRDKGPERRLVRDIVDARRNLGQYFFYGILVILVISFAAQSNVQLALYANLLFLVMLILVAIDSFFLSRRVKKIVVERIPKANTRGIGFYAVMRALSFRRMRIPRPRVDMGDKV